MAVDGLEVCRFSFLIRLNDTTLAQLPPSIIIANFALNSIAGVEDIVPLLVFLTFFSD